MNRETGIERDVSRLENAFAFAKPDHGSRIQREPDNAERSAHTAMHAGAMAWGVGVGSSDRDRAVLWQLASATANRFGLVAFFFFFSFQIKQFLSFAYVTREERKITIFWGV
jgi:hypothetical protein